MAVKGDVGGRLNDWVCLREQHDLQVVAVAQSQLLARKDKLAVRTITHESRTCTGTHHDLRVFA